MTRVVVIALLAGLGFSAQAAAQVVGLDELNAARALWDSAQNGSYRYSYHKYCDCYRDEPPVTVINVSNGEIERVFHVQPDSDREIPAREGSLSLYWTVDELFDKLETAIAADVMVRAEFDPELGYPSLLFIDYDPEFVGDETDLRLTGVELP